MARYRSLLYGRRRGRPRRWRYIVLALLIVAVLAVLICYWPFGKSSLPSAESGAAPGALKTTREAEPGAGLVGIVSGPIAEPNPKVDELITEAMGLISGRPARIIEARDRLNEALPMRQNYQQRQIIKEQLSKLADEWLFSGRIFPQDKLCGSYKVMSGDQLRTIGRQHKVPYEILMELNNISRAENLRAADIIKVVNGPFHARVYRSTFTMNLYLQNTFVKSFPVGLGKPGMETPTGLWVVKLGGKLIKPVWRDPVSGKTYEPDAPDYPLGSRWIGLEGVKGDAKGRTGFAIHGTKDPNQISTASSQGCIRLHNGDAILIYDLLMPGFSQVEVVD